MENDFNFEPEETEFGNFGSEFFDDETFDNFGKSEDYEEIFVRTTILSKNNMIALLCIKTAAEGGAICRVDPREKIPAVQLYDDPKAAFEWFTKSLRTSRLNGWQVVYDGLPLHG